MTGTTQTNSSPLVAITADALSALAPLPDAALHLLAMLDDPTIALREIADAAARDVTIAAAMLRMANSAMFGLRGRVGSIHDALRTIGTAQTRLLILTTGISTMATKELALYRMDKGAFMRHSEAVAMVTTALLREVGQSAIGTAYSAGLLHDIGKIVINDAVQRRYRYGVGLDAIMRKRNCSLLEAERLLCGTDHISVARQLGEMWWLPPELIAAMTRHHDAADAHAPQSLSWAVACANVFVAEVDPTYPKFNKPVYVDVKDAELTHRLLHLARQAVGDALVTQGG